MSDTVMISGAPKKGRGWLKILACLLGGMVLLLVAAYFVCTSSVFFKGVVLPKVSKAFGADVTVADTSISPFSQMVLRDLKVQAKGAEPLLTVAEVRARYSLMDIIGGKINVAELALVSPTVSVVENADGTSNLDVFKQAAKKEEKKPAAPAEPSKAPAVDVKSVVLKDATIRQVRNLKGGGRELSELSNVNVTLTSLKNGEQGKLSLSASVKIDNKAPAPGTNASLQAALNGNFTFGTTPDLMPSTLQGNTTMVVENAGGAFSDLAALAAELDCDATPAEIRQIALKFRKANVNLGQLRVSGPFDLVKTEGKLKAEILNIDRQVLNLAGSAQGIDFGSSVLNSSSQIEITDGGRTIAVAGQLNGSSLTLSRASQTTPALDLRVGFNVTLDQLRQAALIQTLNLDALCNRRPLLRGALAEPMKLEWAKGANAVGESAFNLSLTALNFADWRAFLGTNVGSGHINARLHVVSQQAGRELQFTLMSDGAGLSAAFSSNRIDQAGFNLQLQGSLSDFRSLQLGSTEVKLSQGGQTVGTGTASGSFNLETMDANLGVKFDAALPALARLAPMPGLEITSGSLVFSGRVAQTNLTPSQTESPNCAQQVDGQLQLAGFTGRYADYHLERWEAELTCDVGMKDQQAAIRRVSGSLKQANQSAGAFEANGNYHLASQSGTLSLKLTDLNQNALRPFLASALGDKKLASVSINANLDGRYDAKAESALKGDVQVANLVVNDPSGQIPSTPLESKLRLDLGMKQQTAEVRDCVLALTPTERAKNELALKGRVDFSRTNAIQGGLKLMAESLDVTRYFDLFAGKTNTALAQKPASITTETSAEGEPDAVKLPFQNFTFDTSIGRLFLREVDIANLQASARLDGGHVLVKPLQLTLNGAPVSGSADLDLGVPGFKYDVALNANAIPLAPLVNSFVPERKGQIGGTTTLTTALKGAGVTGASLQKNLSGQFGFSTTNMNLSLANVRSPVINSVINVIVSIPNLIRDPTAAVGSLLGRLTGAPAARSGWADKLTASPVDAIAVRGQAAGGRVELQEAAVRSDAFLAEATGGLALASVLTNSAMEFPVMISLSRSLADEVGLVPAGTPTNAPYARLPDFFAMRGTLGKPDPKIDKLALAAVALKTGAGVLGRTGNAGVDNVGGTLGALGNLLSGQSPAPRAAATNAPAATNRPPAEPVGNLLRGLGGLLGGGKSSGNQTNAPAPKR